jgi:hypothetical protein
MHIDDLKTIEHELGIAYASARRDVSGSHETTSALVHYQDICPPCRRKNLALTQDALWNRGA